MKRKSVCSLTACIVAGSMCALLLSGCGIFPKEEQTLAPPLLTTPKISYDQVTATKGTIEQDVTGSGSIVSVSQQNYSFQYSGGVLDSIRVKLGDTVKKGTVLATLYTDNLDNQIEQQQLSVKQGQLSVDDASAALADDQSSNQPTAKIRQDNSALQNAQFNLQKAQLQLDQLNKEKQRSTITSTIDGQVIFVADVGAGSNVSAFQTLVTVADPTQLQVRYQGGNVNSFTIGNVVSLSYNSQTYTGKVVTNPISMPSAGTSSGGNNGTASQQYVQIKPDGFPSNAAIGDAVSIKYVQQKKDNVIVLPSSYVHTSGGQTYVNMLDKNGLRIQRNVEIGIQTTTQAEIVKGLNAGETVIE